VREVYDYPFKFVELEMCSLHRKACIFRLYT
jgi:hypothetical protein